jgi:hypothetical protein
VTDFIVEKVTECIARAIRPITPQAIDSFRNQEEGLSKAHKIV